MFVMGNTPESWQKAMKWYSIAFIVVDILLMALGVLVASGTIGAEDAFAMFGVPLSAAAGADPAAVMTVMGIGMVVAYVIHLLFTIVVLRGALNPAKMKPGMILYGIYSVICVLGLIGQLTGGTLTGTYVGTCIVAWVGFYGTIMVNRLAK